jgi:hypothetical protein
LFLIVCGIATLPSLLGASGDEIGRIKFPAVSPQDITWEPNTETFYITTFIDGRILQVGADFRFVISELTSPFDAGQFLTGIAYDCVNDTLWIVQPQLREIAEIYRPNPDSEDPNVQNGGPTGRRLQPDFLPVVNPGAQPIPGGLGFDHTGNGGQGSLWILERVGTVIYEVDLQGNIINSFVHPDDPDGHPGNGATAPASSDVQPIFNESGDTLDGFYVNTFDFPAGTEVLRRLDVDGNRTGFSIPLGSTAGTIASFLVRPFEWGSPAQTIDPAVIVVEESRAQIVILDGREPPLTEIFNLECVETGNDVQLSWTNFTTYDRVEVRRGSTIVATLSGNADEYLDTVASPGVYEYQIFVATNDFETRTGTCQVVIGPGQVLEVFDFLGEWPADATVDIDNRILVTDFTGRSVWIYDSDWSTILKLDGTLGDIEPFQDEDDLLTGIAAHSDRRSYFLYNLNTHMIAEIDDGGFSVPGSVPFEIRLPGFADTPERDADPLVIGMDYCPSGNGGQGSLWLVEAIDEMIHEVDLQGNTLSSFLHPDHAPEIPANFANASVAGLAFVPGTDCQLLDITGGKAEDDGNSRVLRLDASGTVQRGCFIPLAGVRDACPTGLVGIAHPRDGTPRLRAIAIVDGEGCLMDVDAAPYELKPLEELTCIQEGLNNTVHLTFFNNENYDAIEVYRDSTKIADLPADSVEFVDPDLPAALYRYDVRAVKGAEATSFLTCAIQVGAGALLHTKILDITAPRQLATDPCDGTFFVTSATVGATNSLYHLDKDLELIEVFEDVLVQFPIPFNIATIAVRGSSDCSIREIYVIGWDTRPSLTTNDNFTLAVLSVTGERLRTIPFAPPHPDSKFVTHPVGLSWDPESDTFYFFERVSLIVTQFDPFGNFLNQFTHPEPPKRTFVFSTGMTADPQTQGLLSTTAGPTDRAISKVIEITPKGGKTGTVLPLATLPVDTIHGISLLNSELKLLATRLGMSLVVTIEAYDPIPEPKSFEGTKNANKALVDLNWSNDANYDELLLYRDGTLIETLPGNSTSYSDPNADDGFHTYAIRGQADSDVSRAAIFELTTLIAFKRADVDGSGLVDITDPLLNLAFQFFGGFDPLCMDAVDTDDSGVVDISDPLSSLTFQFLGHFSIPPPGPVNCGGDPSPDGLIELGCEAYDACEP